MTAHPELPESTASDRPSRARGVCFCAPSASLLPAACVRHALVSTVATLLSLTPGVRLRPSVNLHDYSVCTTATVIAHRHGSPTFHEHHRPPATHTVLVKRPQSRASTHRVALPLHAHRPEWLLRLVDAGVSGARARPNAANLKAERSRRRILDEAFNLVNERFVDDKAVDWQRVRRNLQRRRLRSDEQLERALHWLFAQTDDPFTRYLPAEQLEAVKGDIDGEMCGVGIIFSAERRGWAGNKRVVTIKHVVENSPAAEAGLRKGDRITAIDMIGVGRMTFDEATARMLGKQGRKVLISFCRGSSSTELSILLTRRKFEVPTVSTERVFMSGIGDIAYIHVREFAANTAAQTRKAVHRVYGAGPVTAVVLDLRGNSGGLVNRAIEVAKVFLKQRQTVVRFVGRDGEVTTERCAWGPWLWWRRHLRQQMTESPMVVLVDSDTASASEIVAAALRDNCRAVVVGNSTFGKGSVQAIMPLSNGSGAAVTVARYQTPSGKNIVMGKGLRPDLFNAELSDEGDVAISSLFGHSAHKRLRWIVGRLDKCMSKNCDHHVSGT